MLWSVADAISTLTRWGDTPTGTVPTDPRRKHVSNSVYRYFEPMKSTKADGLVAHVYTQIKKDMGLVPDVPEPFSMHAPILAKPPFASQVAVHSNCLPSDEE